MYVKYVWAEIASSTWEIAREIAISTMDIAFELLSVKREECRYPKRPGSSIADDVVAKTVCVRPHVALPVRRAQRVCARSWASAEPSASVHGARPTSRHALWGFGSPRHSARRGFLRVEGKILGVVF